MSIHIFRCTIIENAQRTLILFILTITFGILINYTMPPLNNKKPTIYLFIECYFHILIIILAVYIIKFLIRKIPIFSCSNVYHQTIKYTEIIFTVIFSTTQLKLFKKLNYAINKKLINNIT